MIAKIGITGYISPVKTPEHYGVGEGYVKAILDQGALPVLIPACEDCCLGAQYAQMIDGLLLPGGEDVHPMKYGQEPVPQVDYMHVVKDDFEIALVLEMHRLNKPVFGICRGLQIINTAFGGTLIQDIPTQTDSKCCHRQAMNIRNEATHYVNIEEGSKLHELLGKQVAVNSYHHQAIGQLAKGFYVTALSTDLIVEAIANKNGNIWGVQWHPECMYERFPAFLNLFKHFISQSITCSQDR